eukprot:3949958-Pyramimonas_sp.AAC.1
MLAQAVFGTPKGRSRTLEFLLGPDPGGDPDHAANSGPIVMWIAALQQHWAPELHLKTCFEKFQAIHDRGWEHVQGPAGA